MDIAVVANVIFTSQPMNAVTQLYNGNLAITVYNGAAKPADGTLWLNIGGLIKLE